MGKFYVSVVEDQVVIDSGDSTFGFILSLYPDEAMSLANSILDASKAAASNVPGEEVWGTYDNRFFDDRYSDHLSGEVSYVYSESD
jgi:hypothetical protein